MTIPLRSVLPLMVLASIALADEVKDATPHVGNRSELSFGFMGAQRDQPTSGLVLDTSSSQALDAAALQVPLTRTLLSGPSWETRWVHQHVRMTVGLQKPFAVNGLDSTPMVIDGRSVSLRSMYLWDIRLGLGGEVTFNRFTPFFDLLGDVRWSNLLFTVDGANASFKAWTFDYSVRAGLRVALEKWMFIALSGEVGLLGSQRYGAQLMVGFSIGTDDRD